MSRVDTNHLFRILKRFSPEVRVKLNATNFDDRGMTQDTSQCPLGYALDISGFKHPFGKAFMIPPPSIIALTMSKCELYDFGVVLDEAYDFVRHYETLDWKACL